MSSDSIQSQVESGLAALESLIQLCQQLNRPASPSSSAASASASATNQDSTPESRWIKEAQPYATTLQLLTRKTLEFDPNPFVQIQQDDSTATPQSSHQSSASSSWPLITESLFGAGLKSLHVQISRLRMTAEAVCSSPTKHSAHARSQETLREFHEALRQSCMTLTRVAQCLRNLCASHPQAHFQICMRRWAIGTETNKIEQQEGRWNGNLNQESIQPLTQIVELFVSEAHYYEKHPHEGKQQQHHHDHDTPSLGDIVQIVKPTLKGILQFIANMLVAGAADSIMIPSSSTSASSSSSSCLTDSSTSFSSVYPSVRTWHWVHTVLIQPILLPLLSLSHRHPDLASMCAAIIHHALMLPSLHFPSLTTDNTTQPHVKMHQRMRNEARRQAATECVDYEDGKLMAHIIESTSNQIATLIEQENEAEDSEGPIEHSAHLPIDLWHWTPSSSFEPIWLISIIQSLLRFSPSYIESMRNQLSPSAWLSFIRYIEFACEMKEDEHGDPSHVHESHIATSMDDKHIAESLARNFRSLFNWLYQRRADSNQTPTINESAAAASSSPDNNTESLTSLLVIDNATNSVINSLGSVFVSSIWSSHLDLLARLRLLLCWSSKASPEDISITSYTSPSVPIPLAKLLIALLNAADIQDGGIMFSELYRKPGHTRHTKVDEDDPLTYSKQFADDHDKEKQATTSSSSTSTPSASAPSSSTASPSTPYMFKSNLLRLIASLCHNCHEFQNSFGSAGVHAALSHSVLDDNNPLMREHAILALRELLNQNEANQMEVAQLTNQGVANQQELRNMGVDARLDEESGKVKINKKDPNEPGQ